MGRRSSSGKRKRSHCLCHPLPKDQGYVSIGWNVCLGLTSWLRQLRLLKPPLDSSLLVSVRDLSPERKRGKEIQLIPVSAAGEAWCSNPGCLAPTKRNPRIVDIDYKGPERSCTATSLNGGGQKGPERNRTSLKSQVH